MSNLESTFPRQASRFQTFLATLSKVSGLGLVLSLVLFIQLLPRLVLKQDSFVTIHDNLDSDFVYRVLIAKPGRFLDGSSIVSELVGGLPRWTYPSGLKLGSVIFYVFPPFAAYVVLESVVRAAAASGMWLLLRDHVPGPRQYRILISITFALLPYYSIFDLSVAGQPWVAWALANLWFQKRRGVSLAVCATFPFASVLQTSGAFVVFLSGLLVLATALLKRKTITRSQFLWSALGVLLLGLGYVVSDFDFLRNFLFGDFVSQRSAWASRAPLSPNSRPLEMWLFGDYHAASLHTPALVVTCMATLRLGWRGQRQAVLHLTGLLVLSAFLAISRDMFHWRILAPLVERVPVLSQVNPRFWWSLPLAWFVTLAVIGYHWSLTAWSRAWFQVLLVVQLLWVVRAPLRSSSELWLNYKSLAEYVLHRPRTSYSYRQFVSADAFQRIREHVGSLSAGRFLAIGFHPSALALNGFDCADGYRDNYSLAYKGRFRRLIAGELAYDKRNREYFDTFGNRAYVYLRNKKVGSYSTEPQRSRGMLNKLNLNEAALHDLDVEWITSTYRLQNSALLPFLRFEGKYADSSGGLTLYLYRVLCANGTLCKNERSALAD